MTTTVHTLLSDKPSNGMELLLAMALRSHCCRLKGCSYESLTPSAAPSRFSQTSSRVAVILIVNH